MTDSGLLAFVTESNKIEGIHRPPTEAELRATRTFLDLPVVQVVDLVRLVGVYAPGAPLRTQPHMNVYVGDHVPPRGGPHIEAELRALLERTGDDPHEIHCKFESLHPFLDGNGRSGRALWAWHMQHLGLRFEKIGFLHSFYYQTLSKVR